jgi:hypothetical protein
VARGSVGDDVHLTPRGLSSFDLGVAELII